MKSKNICDSQVKFYIQSANKSDQNQKRQTSNNTTRICLAMREKKLRNFLKVQTIVQTTNMLTTKAKKQQQQQQKSNNNNCWQLYQMLSLFALCLMLHIGACGGHDGIPSQISPKSIDPIDILAGAPIPTTQLLLESTMLDSVDLQANHDLESAPSPLDHNENETRQYIRVERSASPKVQEDFPKHGPNNVHDNDKPASGRYFQYDIKPTTTIDGKVGKDEAQQTTGLRGAKKLDDQSKDKETVANNEQSFLLKGGPRHNLSGSPISPKNSSAMLAVAHATAVPHNPRQNGNPDIQDIITGIVKLLNGNVNVHANTQGLRRPTASRINNRGPPRISEVQPLPVDFEQKYGTSVRPPPYPFDRPERPFITGVPIPEQIVPLRPGFVSNRPPWHRNKPRPPITTTMGVHRPVSQYKPIPSTQMSPPLEDGEDMKPPSAPTAENTGPDIYSEGNESEPETVPTADTSYEQEFSNEDVNAQYIEVSDQEEDDKPKPHDKNKIIDYSSIIETSSVVNTVMNIRSSYVPMSMNKNSQEDLDPSVEEVIFMTPSKTPALETVTTKVDNIEGTTSNTPQAISITTTPLTENLNTNPTTQVLLVDPTPITSDSLPKAEIVSSTTPQVINEAENIELNKNPTTTPQPNIPTSPQTSPIPQNYQPRPGIVLDDPEFKPGGRPRPQRPPQSPPPPTYIQPTRQQLPPGYGEIFDVTLSAIQGPGTVGGSQQTINIKPYGSYGNNAANAGDIIISASGDDGFVSIDGKRTYINLFGEPTDTPTAVQKQTSPAATNVPQLPIVNTAKQNTSSGIGSVSVAQPPAAGVGYGVAQSEVLEVEQPNKVSSNRPVTKTSSTHPATRPQYRQRTTQPPVRIDTCIVGDDTTCDQAQQEWCKTENGVSSCHCRPGYSRRKHREPCRKVITFYLGLRVDRIYEHRIVWDNKLLDRYSEPYGQLSYEAIRAIDSAMSMTPYSDEFMNARVNNIYRGDPKLGGSGVFVNMTIKLDESVESLRPNLKSDVQKHLLGVLHRRNNNIGNSVLYVTSPEGAISALHDLDECESRDLNDCHASATCSNFWGSFRCVCASGFRDPWADQAQRAGRDCQACADSYCNNRGSCSFSQDGIQTCHCESGYYGGQCEVDGEVLGVAIGASISAVLIIVLTVICLVMWSRRWQREQKNAIGSPVFGYMNTAPLKSAAMAQPAYQVTLEDRMRWAQIADVMAQSNHYGAEPIGPTRPSSAMFGYPNLQTMGLGTLGAMSTLQSNLQMHQNNSNLNAPVPLPRRLGLGPRSNGMRTLENSSSSEEEDRTDLLGRNFQVPRPKSRSNGSMTNQSGIYYDVDYEPSGNGIGNTSVDHLYGSQIHSHSGTPGIPMSTYTSGRMPSNSYYMK